MLAFLEAGIVLLEAKGDASPDDAAAALVGREWSETVR